MRTSFLTLFSAAAGAGILSMPKVISSFGLLVGTGSVIFFALLTYRIFSIINELIVKSGRKSYANLVSYYFGKVGTFYKTIAKVFIQFIIFSKCASGILYASVCKFD